MNEKNLGYLKDNLKYMGFGESLHGALEQHIAEGKADFTLTLEKEMDRKAMQATLHFRKGDTTDTYFFNKWEATLKTEVGTTGQTFYVNKGHGITLKEGFNLLEGRSVHKELTDREGQAYKAWLTLDRGTLDTSGNYRVQQYHSNYGFDLEKVLAALPIRELASEEQKNNLLRSLERGNRQAVTFEKNGFAEKLFIEAAPQFKSINAYDHSGAVISNKELARRFDVVPAKAEQQGQEVTPLGPARRKINDKEVVPGERPAPGGTSKAVKPAEGGSGELLPKKRTATGKGLHP